MKCRVLLVAKPWRGGLASYIFSALNDLFPDEVMWLSTRPQGLREHFAYKRDRRTWQGRLVKRIAAADAAAILFINHLPFFEELPRRTHHVLWLTDGPDFRTGELSCYGKVCLSDSGYADSLRQIVGDRFAGEVGFGFLPALHRAVVNPSRTRDICFIGNQDSKRDPYLKALLTTGTRSTILGNYFLRHPLFWGHPTRFRPSVSNQVVGEVYGRHKLSLNIHAKVVRCGTNMRTFECAGYGIPQLVEYRPGLEDYFEPGEEVATFSGVEEFSHLLMKSLENLSGLATMAELARMRCEREHSYQARCRSLLDGLGVCDPEKFSRG